jgi:predicted nucleic acid-binding protein
MRWVSDTSPVSALALIGRIGLLRDQAGSLEIPMAVWVELRRLGNAVALRSIEEAVDAGWLRVMNCPDKGLVSVLKRTLDLGESEAISLAAHLPGTRLLIDETQGRTVAREMGIQVTGTLGILLRAKKEGALDSFANEIRRLRSEAGFFIAPELEQELLNAAGEG